MDRSKRVDIFLWQDRRCSRTVEYDTEKDHLNIDAIIITGGWPQFDKEKYIQTIKPKLREILAKRILIISADLTDTQIELVSEGLSHHNVGQSPYQMGVHAVHTMYAIVTDKEYKKKVITPLSSCNQQKLKLCLAKQFN